MERELEILRDVVSRFGTAGISYMLTGSFALNYYAEPRMTRDIDLVVQLEQNDADRIVRLFDDDYYVDTKAVFRAITNRSLFNIIHKQEVVKIDLIVRRNTEYEQWKFQRRAMAVIAGMEIAIISKEDLILSKLLWARSSHSEFQLRDVRNLLATGYDADYVQGWAEKLAVNDLLNECLNE